MSQLYDRLDEWARDLSRARYAGLAGVLSAVTLTEISGGVPTYGLGACVLR